ncbi:hypothetical protein [Brevundimonas sp.]|uniref:DUF6894 family protein n=1 Tax=Brevundimonas sp. TaxID=1871086 RepID=UPI001D7ACFFD|nr:hypothetical protein [Brevundimonas sp.]MBA4000155.1 hypothetical protein [Brevundimonas sp.]
MTRYHFHAADGSHFRDEDGEELVGLEEAKAVALNVLTEMLHDKSDEFWREKSFVVSVKDETGRLVACLTTIAVVDPVAQPDVPPEV